MLLLLGGRRPPCGRALVLQEGGRQQGVRGALEVLLHAALGRKRRHHGWRGDEREGEQRGLGVASGDGRVQAQVGLLQDRRGG